MQLWKDLEKLPYIQPGSRFGSQSRIANDEHESGLTGYRARTRRVKAVRQTPLLDFLPRFKLAPLIMSEKLSNVPRCVVLVTEFVIACRPILYFRKEQDDFNTVRLDLIMIALPRKVEFEPHYTIQ